MVIKDDKRLKEIVDQFYKDSMKQEKKLNKKGGVKNGKANKN